MLKNTWVHKKIIPCNLSTLQFIFKTRTTQMYYHPIPNGTECRNTFQLPDAPHFVEPKTESDIPRIENNRFDLASRNPWLLETTFPQEMMIPIFAIVQVTFVDNYRGTCVQWHEQNSEAEQEKICKRSTRFVLLPFFGRVAKGISCANTWKGVHLAKMAPSSKPLLYCCICCTTSSGGWCATSGGVLWPFSRFALIRSLSVIGV